MRKPQARGTETLLNITAESIDAKTTFKLVRLPHAKIRIEHFSTCNFPIM